MNFKAFIIACAVISLGVVSSTVPAHSQIFNDPKNASAPVPVFVAPQRVDTAPTTYNKPGVQGDLPNQPAKSEAEIISRNKIIAQQNATRTQQGRDAANAAYAASVASEDANRAARAAKTDATKKIATAGGAVAAGQNTAPPPIMVFTGAKKTDDKPTRLFNVQ